MSDYWNFWKQVQHFKEIKEIQLLAGTAYLLFKKFLANDAYRFIDPIDKIMQAKLEQQLNEAVENSIYSLLSSYCSEFEITSEFFDEVIAKVEDIMEDGLFVFFFASEMYQQFIEATRLERGFKMTEKKATV